MLCMLLGEAMERGLRECCRSIRIGKILIRHDPDTNEAKLYYAKFPSDIDKMNILLLFPNLGELQLTALQSYGLEHTENSCRALLLCMYIVLYTVCIHVMLLQVFTMVVIQLL